MELDEDDSHHHHHDHDHDHDHSHRHDKERNDTVDQLDLGIGMKRRRVISREGSENRQNDDDWAECLHREVDRQQLRKFRVQRNRREQTRRPVQDSVYIATLRTAQKEAFRRRNDISPNLDEESCVSWTSQESINQETDIPVANFRAARQLLAAQVHSDEDEAMRLRIEYQADYHLKSNKEQKEASDHKWDQHPSMYPKYKGRQPNRIIAQFTLIRAGI
ncbi:MAG: hypothetical protein EZS28_026398 [Streblomastix strix]|uniref:Uncharacterized protein n=1 Tax=Streblomastix strix TaxID=222440 RepID=A0A5J4V7G4_9EUKA|nr:MAG: hypothetical protein EZS28_026398 [Streblomastix strix]